METILIAEQTKLVNDLLEKEFLSFENIENYYEDDFIYEEGETDILERVPQPVYFWFLVHNKYKKTFSELNFPIIDIGFDNTIWIGQTWYGASWEHSGIWDKLKEKLEL